MYDTNVGRVAIAKEFKVKEIIGCGVLYIC